MKAARQLMKRAESAEVETTLAADKLQKFADYLKCSHDHLHEGDGRKIFVMRASCISAFG